QGGTNREHVGPAHSIVQLGGFPFDWHAEMNGQFAGVGLPKEKERLSDHLLQVHAKTGQIALDGLLDVIQMNRTDHLPTPNRGTPPTSDLLGLAQGMSHRLVRSRRVFVNMRRPRGRVNHPSADLQHRGSVPTNGTVPGSNSGTVHSLFGSGP